MSKEKQNSGSCKISNNHIEEMAYFLWKNTLIHTEDLCHDVSETLYNAGYRKQSEVIEEFANRLKEKLYTVPTVYNAHFRKMVDDIVTEMKGGE